jgi:hypothetical protein
MHYSIFATFYLCDQPLCLPNLNHKVPLEFARPVDRLFIVIAGDNENRTQCVALVVDCVQPIFRHALPIPVIPDGSLRLVGEVGCGF